ncbi:CCN family member 5 isoform X3 [Candoia aspera]|uniref:CCN family member 5 isoform X3 n=1 Tax=Candoia aspera TaxID=51853 RepID=UPI002FD81A23
MKLQFLLISFLCLLSKVDPQHCQTPCYCPWLPPRCPPGSPLVLDGCGCCNICARRLGEPCNYLNVCDQNQGLICDYSNAPTRRAGTCNYEEDGQDSCEVNGKIYQEGEVFQPSCKVQCRCSGGGFICIPLCSEDVRLPTPDCPYPRRVEIPGKCCQEWICEREPRQILQDNMAEWKRKPLINPSPLHSEVDVLALIQQLEHQKPKLI